MTFHGSWSSNQAEIYFFRYKLLATELHRVLFRSGTTTLLESFTPEFAGNLLLDSFCHI